MKPTNIEEVLSMRGIYTKGKRVINCPLGTHQDKNASFDISNGLAHCHSCGWAGDYIKLYARFEGLENGEAFKLLEQSKVSVPTGKVYEKIPKSPEKNESMIARFVDLKKNEWSQEALFYLQMRGIEFPKVKNLIAHEGEMIYAPLKNQDGEVVGIQSRSISSKIFKIEKGSQSGIFWKNDNSSKKELFVVEGLFDWLSVRQETQDVLGFVSATAYIETANIVEQYENIYWLGDTDSAGEVLRKKFFDQFKHKNIFYRKQTNEKQDVNDLVAFEIESNNIIDGLKALCVLSNNGQTAKSISPDIYTWGVEKLNKLFHTPKKGKFTLLLADENAGKSTFCNFIGRRNAALGHNVYYLSLESTEEEVYTSIAYSYAGITPEQYNTNKHLTHPVFMKKMQSLKEDKSINIIGRKIDSMLNIDELCATIESLEHVDMLFIDNLSAISREGKNDNVEMKNIIQKISNLATKLNTAIILVHHYKKRQSKESSRWRDLHESSGSGEIIKFAPQILQIARNREPASEEESAEFFVKEAKNRVAGKTEETIIYFRKGDFYNIF